MQDVGNVHGAEKDAIKVPRLAASKGSTLTADIDHVIDELSGAFPDEPLELGIFCDWNTDNSTSNLKFGDERGEYNRFVGSMLCDDNMSSCANNRCDSFSPRESGPIIPYGCKAY